MSSTLFVIIKCQVEESHSLLAKIPTTTNLGWIDYWQRKIAKFLGSGFATNENIAPTEGSIEKYRQQGNAGQGRFTGAGVIEALLNPSEVVANALSFRIKSHDQICW